MEQKYSKKQLEEIYLCKISAFSQPNIFGGVSRVLVAIGKMNDDMGSVLFNDAQGCTLDELHEDIRKQIFLCNLE